MLKLDSVEDVREAVAIAVGAGSVCWDEDGVFDSRLASVVVEELAEWIITNALRIARR